MCARQAPIAAAFAVGIASLAGCGSVSNAFHDEFVAAPVTAFTGEGKLSTASGQTTFRSATIELASDVLDPPLSPAALAVSGDGVSFGDGSKSDPAARETAPPAGSRHAEVTFHFAEEGEDACASGEVSGPVGLTVVDGMVTVNGAQHPVSRGAQNAMRDGRFSVCVETWADFDGDIDLDGVSLEFGSVSPGEDKVEICHVTAGEPDDRHTITISTSSLPAHLAHGDTVGACTFGNPDADGDGVADVDDACPDTPAGDVVDATGCSVLMVAANAGPDRAALEGDLVEVNGIGTVVQGDYNEADLVLSWQLTAGGPVDFTATGGTLQLDTTGFLGEATFVLTVSTAGGSVSASDEMVLVVHEALMVGAAAGRWHNAVQYENNLVRLWGWNRYGQLGDGSPLRDVSSVDTGPTQTLYAKTDGTVWALGQNALGNSSTPMQVPDATGIVQVSATLEGGMMLDASGTVWGFGDAENRFCELGGEAYIGNVGVLGPVEIPGLPQNIVAVSSGAYHSVALDADGVAWVWGGSRFGCTPFAALDNVVTVEAGDNNVVLFIRGDGTAWAMGFNFYGQLGNGTTLSNYSTPTQVVGMSNVVEVAAGQYHSMFLQADGTLWAAGWNHDCQLGFAPVGDDKATTPGQVNLIDVSMVTAGNTHSIAVTSDNAMWVWGLNNAGQLSGGANETLSSPVCTPTQISFP